MGESLDRGHVMAISLWDDVEVNMLWLDSAFPLNKPESSPGVRRGDCPGGEESTPSYVREHFPDGWVSFQDAFVGPIGSYLAQHPVPTPAPTTPQPVSPTPNPSPTCKMIDAQVPVGKRCKGKPVGGWGELGKGMTEMECQQACTSLESCVFAVHKQGMCSHFRRCNKFKKQAGFSVWEKTCDVSPSPNPACAALCGRADLTAGGETCNYLSRFPTLCNQTLVRDGSIVTPCHAASSACEPRLDSALECPGFGEQCTAVSLVSAVRHVTSKQSAQQHAGLTKWRFNKWRALLQTSQSLLRMEL